MRDSSYGICGCGNRQLTDRSAKGTLQLWLNKPTPVCIYSTNAIMMHNRRCFKHPRLFAKPTALALWEEKTHWEGTLSYYFTLGPRKFWLMSVNADISHIRTHSNTTVLFLSKIGCKHGHQWHHKDRPPLLSFMTTPIHAISRKIHPYTKEPSSKAFMWRAIKQQLLVKSI